VVAAAGGNGARGCSMKRQKTTNRDNHIRVEQIDHTGIPRIFARPTNSEDLEPHLRLTTDDILVALKLAAKQAPSPRWEDSLETLRHMVSTGNAAAMLYVLWNMAASWSFDHGRWWNSNGEARGLHAARDPQRRGGGPRPGSGRKRGSSDADILQAFNRTNTNLTKAARCNQAVELGDLKRADGEPMSADAVKQRLQRQRKAGTNR